MGFSIRLSIMTALFPLLSLSFGAYAAESGFSAKIFDKDSNKEKLLFTYKQDVEVKDNTRILVNTFTDSSDGSVAAIETVEFANIGGDEVLRRYNMKQKQINAEGTIELKEGKAHFTYTKDGKIKTASEKAGDNFVVGSSALPYLRKHWSKIEKGEKVPVRLAVIDRLETVGFEFSREREVEMNGQKVYVLKMKPSSFIIAAIVNPLYWYVTADGQKLLEINGRSQVKRKIDGEWKDFDAVTVYSYGDAGGNSK